MSFVSLAVRGACVSALALALAGCGMFKSFSTEERIDYRSVGARQTLEVPPDLTQLQRDGRYNVPGAAGTATYSSYALERGQRGPAATNALLPGNPDMRIERTGGQRYLVVNRNVDVVWPAVREFWQELGFVIRTEVPDAGILETDWAENRAKIPQGVVRDALGKALDSIYSTGERDKFRTRLERVGNTTEIYISHRGMVETLTGAQKESTVWTTRPADPELEAEFLRRLMTRLGFESERAKTLVAGTAAAAPAAPRAVLRGGNSLEVGEGFDRAWRQVGLALDRVGFTVEDRNRTQGIYFVRYADPDVRRKDEPGFFSKLFGAGDKAVQAPQYRITVKEKGAVSEVTVQDKDGGAPGEVGPRILTLLQEQLK